MKDLDAVVIDMQDAGVRFYTYEAVTGYFLEAAAREKNEFHHDLEIIVLDRPSLIGGEQVQGPVSDAGLESYTDYMPLPVRHGLTLGELAHYINGEATSTFTHSDALFASTEPARWPACYAHASEAFRRQRTRRASYDHPPAALVAC